MRCEELLGLGVKRFGPLLRYDLLRMKWTIRCEELVGLVVKRLGPLSRYGLLIKGEVDHEV